MDDGYVQCAPIRVVARGQLAQVRWGRGLVKSPPRGEGDARLGVEVAVGDVGCDCGRGGVVRDPWALLEDALLVEADVEDGSAAADLGLDDAEEGASGLGAVEVCPVGTDGVWLVARGEMGAGNF